MIKLGSVFSNGAVLQHGMPIPVWGETEPYLAIMAELAGHRFFCRASGSGDFLLRLPAMQPGGPYELKILPAEGSRTGLLSGWLRSSLLSGGSCWNLLRFPHDPPGSSAEQNRTIGKKGSRFYH